MPKVRNIRVSPVRSTPDGFSIGNRVAYLTESRFRFSQEDLHTKACPPNDFLVRSVVVKSGMCGVYLIDADGNNAGMEETLHLRKLDGEFRLFSVLDDARDSGSFGDVLDVNELHRYVRANHDEHSRISLAKFGDLQLDRLLAVYVSSRIDKEKEHG